MHVDFSNLRLTLVRYITIFKAFVQSGDKIQAYPTHLLPSSEEISKEIRDIAMELAKEIGNAITSALKSANHDATSSSALPSISSIQPGETTKPMERPEDKQGLSEIIQPRKVDVRKTSDLDVKAWYEEISKNPWRSIISEKGKC